MQAVAQVLVAPDAFALRELEVPPPGPGELRMRVLGCGICGSDKVLARTSPPGTVLGHEVIAEVESCGPGVTQWQPGDRAIPVGDHIGMGQAGRLGGFSEYLVVSADVCVRVPESLPSRHAVLGEPLGNGLHFVRRSRLQAGQRVAILGAGQIGLSILYWARRAGAARIVVSEPAALRAQLARALGADTVVDPDREADAGAAITAALGGRPHVVFEATGRPEVMRAAMPLVAPGGGVVVIAGITLDEIAIRPVSLVLKETDLVFPLGTVREEVEEVLAVMARGELPADRFISHRIRQSDVPATLRDLGRPTDQIKVVVDYSLLSRPPLTDREVEEIRREFPALQRYAYFTTNGLGVLPVRAAEVLRERIDGLSRNAIVSTLFANEPAVTDTRAAVASLLGCDAEEVAFCRNTSEGVLWAASGLRWQARDEVLLVQGEYAANVLPWMAQESRGVVTRLLAQRERRITPAMVAEAWGPRTRLLAVSFVQYNSGFRADLGGLAAVAHARGGLLFCDAIQGLGALRLDVRQAGIDFLAAGTHKWLLGLQGLGIFYCRRDRLDLLDPTHVATGSLQHDQDPDDPDAPYDRTVVGEARRFEEGTRNYLAIAALGQSLQLIAEIGIERIEARVRELTDYVVRQVEERGCRVESPRGADEWSGIVLFRPPAGGPSASDLVAAMHAQRITINAREGCIHMGVHFYNTRAEIDRVVTALGR